MASTMSPEEAERRLHLANTVLRRALQTAPALDELSTHDRAILACLAAGLSQQQIARLFGLSPSTVKNHVANIRRRIDAPGSNRGEGAIAQLAALYVAAMVRYDTAVASGRGDD